MSEPTTPLREHLAGAMDEASVQRMWNAVGQKRARRIVRRKLAVTGGAALSLALVLGVGLARFWSRGVEETPPIALRSGASLEQLLAATAEVPPVGELAFDDGSTVSGSRGVRLRVLENERGRVSFAMSAGRIDVDIVPHGPRRWIFECGAATVEVLGTHFVIERGEDQVRVAVTRGVVLVRGANVPDGARRLEAGMHIVVRNAIAALQRTSPVQGTPAGATTEPASDIVVHAQGNAQVNAEAHQPPPPPSQAPEPPPPSQTSESPPPSRPAEGLRAGTSTTTGHATPSAAWRVALAAAASDAACAAFVAESPTAQAGVSVDDVLAVVDACRTARHPELAEPLLAGLVTRTRGTPRCAVIAMAWGRVHMQLGHPREAARAFEVALGERPPSSVEEVVRAGLFEAFDAAHDAVHARAAAADYLRGFPDGVHAPRARALVAAGTP